MLFYLFMSSVLFLYLSLLPLSTKVDACLVEGIQEPQEVINIQLG